MNKKSVIAMSVLGAAALTFSAGHMGSVRAQEPAPAPADAAVPLSQHQPAIPQSTDALVGTAMSYQGQLQKSGGAYNGNCNFQFSLWDAATGGAQKGSTLAKNAVAVANGLFSVELDFGNQFTGDARWLQTAVQCVGDPAFTTLSPRQPQNAVPYAMSVRPGASVAASDIVVSGDGKALLLKRGDHNEIYSSGADLYVGTEITRGIYFNPFGGGNVGIHTNFPQATLEVNGDAMARTLTVSGDGKALVLRRGGHNEIYSSGADLYVGTETTRGIYFNPFGGGNVGIHTNFPQATLDVNGTSRSRVVEITGGSDLAERFSQADGSVAEPGTVMIIDPDNPGQIKPSAGAYDRKVAGIVSGAGDIRPGLTLHQEGVAEGDTVMAIAGRVYVKAEALSGPIEPGDLLTTSDMAGYAMKASDDARSHGAVIGKAMTGLSEGTGLVLVIVNLQ